MGSLCLWQRKTEDWILHVGYSEAEFTNKQVDDLIKIIKSVKVYG